MRSAAPSIVNLAFSGPAVLDEDVHQDTTGAATYRVGYGSWLFNARTYRRMPGVRFLGLGANGTSSGIHWLADDLSHIVPQQGKVLSAFEVQLRALQMGGAVTAPSQTETWGFIPGVGALGVAFYACQAGDPRPGETIDRFVQVQTRAVHPSAGLVRDAAPLAGARLLDHLPMVDRVPVSWKLQPGERLFALATWDGWDFGSNPERYQFFLSANVSCEQQA
ncbi:MAG: hypothetical protein ACK58T_29325 [Phycisphaerae bacterium]